MTRETISAWEWKQICHARTKEKDWQKRVEGVLRANNFLIYHTLRSKGSTPGFPDICAVKGERDGSGGRLIYIENKTEKGKVSEAQKEWLDALATVPGVEVYIFRPSQFDELLKVAKGEVDS